MKIKHIIIIVAIIAAIGVIISTVSDSSSYSDFTEAAKHPGQEFHVIGTLNKDKDIYYDGAKDANLFSFYMFDKNNVELKVIYHGGKPQDFEKSEQIILIGKIEGDDFLASSLLLKCPSKYTEENNPEKFSEKEFSSE